MLISSCNIICVTCALVHNWLISYRVFSGQLYQADPETKAWSMMCKGLVTLTLLPVGNKRWKIVASKGAEKVWEYSIADECLL